MLIAYLSVYTQLPWRIQYCLFWIENMISKKQINYTSFINASFFITLDFWWSQLYSLSLQQFYSIFEMIFILYEIYFFSLFFFIYLFIFSVPLVFIDYYCTYFSLFYYILFYFYFIRTDSVLLFHVDWKYKMKNKKYGRQIFMHKTTVYC